VPAWAAAQTPAEQVAPMHEGYSVPRTPWGDPDIAGIWPSIDMVRVPVERPAQYGTRIFMTAEEHAIVERREEERIVAMARDGAGGATGAPGLVTGGPLKRLSEVWIEWRTSRCRARVHAGVRGAFPPAAAARGRVGAPGAALQARPSAVQQQLMSLLPKEHGAYGQITFPLIAAFGVAGLSAGGLLIAAAVTAGFMAHEPASVLLGQRGPRARRELGRRASWWLGGCAFAAGAAGLGALVTLPGAIGWTLAVPLVPALLLAVATFRGEEKSWYGETAAALAFSGAAVPIAMAGGATLATGMAVAIPFALLFVASTLAVRVVILRVRGGGDPAAAGTTRRAALGLVAGGLVALWVLVANQLVAPSILIAAAPGLLTAAGIALRPPPPAHLRTLGWTLVAVSVLTTLIVITTA
jgi:hypothetical protein